MVSGEHAYQCDVPEAAASPLPPTGLPDLRKEAKKQFRSGGNGEKLERQGIREGRENEAENSRAVGEQRRSGK